MKSHYLFDEIEFKATGSNHQALGKEYEVTIKINEKVYQCKDPMYFYSEKELLDFTKDYCDNLG